MEDITFSFKKLLQHSSKQGLFGGLILIGFTVVVYVFGISMYGPAMGLLSLAITWGTVIIFLYRAAAGYRAELTIPRMDYLSASLVLFVTAIIIFYMSAIFGFLLNTVIDPEYHLELIRQFEDEVIPQVPEEMRADLLARTTANLQPVKQFVSSLIASPVMALVISLIMALFIRKNPKYQEKI